MLESRSRMSLRRQFSLAFLTLFLSLLLIVVMVSVSGTRRYLEQQLASHAQDAATALSLPLGQALGKDDLVLAQANVASMFDRGYFKSITVLGNDRSLRFKRELTEKVEDVPPWFVSVFPISAGTGEAFLGSGWRQLGKVLVVSQPTFAYQYLWHTTSSLAVWLAALCALAWVLLQAVLLFVLRPLRAIEKAAIDILAGNFEPITQQTRTSELTAAVHAMNQMSRHLGSAHKADRPDDLTGRRD